MKECNSGVCCDVATCKYNKNGCKCKLDTINVTMAGDVSCHFCGSFRQK